MNEKQGVLLIFVIVALMVYFLDACSVKRVPKDSRLLQRVQEKQLSK